jgi:hypothetical protein
MRALLTLSLVLLIAGLALGLLNLYIAGRIGMALVFGIVGAIIGLTASAVIFTRRK